MNRSPAPHSIVIALLALASQLWLAGAYAFPGQDGGLKGFCGDVQPQVEQQLRDRLAPELLALSGDDREGCADDCRCCAPLFSAVFTGSAAIRVGLHTVSRTSLLAVEEPAYSSRRFFRPLSTGPPLSS